MPIESVMNLCVSVERQLLLAINRWQDVAGPFVHSSMLTHTAEYTASLQSTEGSSAPLWLMGWIEAGAQMEGGPVYSPLMSR